MGVCYDVALCLSPEAESFLKTDFLARYFHDAEIDEQTERVLRAELFGPPVDPDTQIYELHGSTLRIWSCVKWFDEVPMFQLVENLGWELLREDFDYNLKIINLETNVCDANDYFEDPFCLDIVREVPRICFHVPTIVESREEKNEKVNEVLSNAELGIEAVRLDKLMEVSGVNKYSHLLMLINHSRGFSYPTIIPWQCSKTAPDEVDIVYFLSNVMKECKGKRISELPDHVNFTMDALAQSEIGDIIPQLVSIISDEAVGKNGGSA